jgi:SagB-type dehydrogenase family enzyme
MSTAHDYLGAILQRCTVPMEPRDFRPNWGDSPRRAKYYPDAERLPLPAAPSAAPADGHAPGFTLPLLTDMLQHSYGYLGRRMAPQANSDLPWLPNYTEANWWRGTASGGGLYPVSVYWVTGARGPVLPGVYHYAPQHHEMRRLLVGDVTAQVRAALADPARAGAATPAGTADTDQFLILGVKFWQNAFKYGSFCFHVVTMDIGTVVHTWQLLAAEHGLALAPRLWFDDAALGGLLGVAPQGEGIFAVVPLPWAEAGREPGRPSAPDHGAPDHSVPDHSVPDHSVPDHGAWRAPAVRHRDSERSHRVLSFGVIEDMAQAMRPAAAWPAGRAALSPAASLPPRPGLGAHVSLPPARPAGGSVRAALRSRRSSFGRFSGAIPTEPADLAAVVDAAVDAAAFPCDATGPANSADGAQGVCLAKFYVFVNHVRGVPPGVYEYDQAQRRLLRIDADPPGAFLQSTYFLENYNLEQVGAVVVPTLRAAAVLDAVGGRGYLLANAIIGAVAQGVYTAAARAGLGCGAALGFDNAAYAERLGLTGSDEVPLLILMIGHERALPGDYVYRIA